MSALAQSSESTAGREGLRGIELVVYSALMLSAMLTAVYVFDSADPGLQYPVGILSMLMTAHLGFTVWRLRRRSLRKSP